MIAKTELKKDLKSVFTGGLFLFTLIFVVDLTQYTLLNPVVQISPILTYLYGLAMGYVFVTLYRVHWRKLWRFFKPTSVCVENRTESQK